MAAMSEHEPEANQPMPPVSPPREVAGRQRCVVLPEGPVTVRQVRQWLADGQITDCQLVPWGSNYTFAVVLELPDRPPLLGIYKPKRGEAPLWDFPAGTLYQREYAAYLLSRVLGWSFIPPTVIRSGPHGIGTVQLYIEPDDTLLRNRASQRLYADQLRRIALFDLITNNADRKASHYFVGRYDRRVWGIDHGLTFHVDPKLRTVLWDFCGELIPPALLADLRRLARHAGLVRALLRPYIQRAELDQLFVRVQHLLAQPLFPMLNPRRNIPFGW
ncbi:SCO1664 family protein [Thermorudis peleae]|uniref:SCO1664 family protein n=1 Tax=Thermorudis peleae TaxID=1382356 RepID=UPI000ADFCCEE|nr:SCO1664 family protein [Thermorudis peleae]